MASDTSGGGFPRLTVACVCVTLISVLFFSVGFVRLELELRDQRQKIIALQQDQKSQTGTEHQGLTEEAILKEGN